MIINKFKLSWLVGIALLIAYTGNISSQAQASATISFVNGGPIGNDADISLAFYDAQKKIITYQKNDWSNLVGSISTVVVPNLATLFCISTPNFIKNCMSIVNYEAYTIFCTDGGSISGSNIVPCNGNQAVEIVIL
jgi:hypothetical protein